MSNTVIISHSYLNCVFSPPEGWHADKRLSLNVLYVVFVYTCVYMCVCALSLVGDTLNCRQECYPVRIGKRNEATIEKGGERDTQTERQRGREDKPVWQVCVTVRNPSCKADVEWKTEREGGRERVTQRDRSWCHCRALPSLWTCVNTWSTARLEQVRPICYWIYRIICNVCVYVWESQCVHILVVSLSDQLVLIVDSVTQVTQMGGLVTEQNRCFCKLTLRLTCFRKHHADCSCGFIV